MLNTKLVARLCLKSAMGLILITAFFSCKGQDGAQGPQGASGNSNEQSVLPGSITGSIVSCTADNLTISITNNTPYPLIPGFFTGTQGSVVGIDSTQIACAEADPAGIRCSSIISGCDLSVNGGAPSLLPGATCNYVLSCSADCPASAFTCIPIAISNFTGANGFYATSFSGPT